MIENPERQKIIESIDAQLKHNIFYMVRKDIGRYKNVPDAFSASGFWVVLIYRLSHFFELNRLGFIGFLFQIFSLIVFNCDISRKLEAGPGFLILHTQGIFIGPYIKFGYGVGVNSGCFISPNNNSIDEVPVCGDWVLFGPGSKAFGKIFIGERSVIGPNAVVTKNIPANHTVLPPQSHIIKKYELKNQMQKA